MKERVQGKGRGKEGGELRSRFRPHPAKSAKIGFLRRSGLPATGERRPGVGLDATVECALFSSKGREAGEDWGGSIPRRPAPSLVSLLLCKLDPLRSACS